MFALAFVLVGCAVAGKAPRLELFAALVLTGIASAGCSYAEHYFGHLVAFSMLADLRVALFDRLAQGAPASVGGLDIGAVLPAAVRDIDRVEAYYAHTIVPRVAALTVPVLAGITVWQLTQFTAGLTLVVGLWLGAFALPALSEGPITKAKKAELKHRSVLAQNLTAWRRALPDLLSTDRQGQALAAEAALSNKVGADLERVQRYRGVRAGIGWAWDALTLAAVAALAAFPAAQPLPRMLAALGVAVGALASATALREGSGGRTAAKQAALRVFAMMRQAPQQLHGKNWSTEGAPEVIFDAVSFKYPKTERGLNRLDLHIYPGQYVVLSGPSGSGKSTLGALLARAWDPDEGGIIVDGVYLNTVSAEAARKRICVVSQEGKLITDTVANNLRLGEPYAETDLLAALKVVALDKDIEALGGLEATITPTQLSGGQTSRLLLARALLRQADMYVLDEVTSHLDSKTLKQIRTNLKSRLQGKTVLEITHRVNEIADPDLRYIQIENGRKKV